MTNRRLLFALAVIVFLWNVWGYDLWAPDEPYFGEGAREMVADGNWIVPHVNGVVTSDKPPMFFWLIAILSLPFGDVLPLTARLPSVLAALGSLWLVIRLGRNLYDRRVANLAAAMLTVTYMFWDKARSAQTDMLLHFFILAALVAFAEFRSGAASPRKAGMIFWAACALGVLTKGPVGILLPLGIVVLTLASDRKLGRLIHFAPLAGPLVFVAIIVGWVVPANLWNPELYTVGGALREHFVDRAVHGRHHLQPVWYYAKALPPLLLPWTALVPGAILLAWRKRNDADRFLLVVVFFILIFFTVSSEKRTLYVLPSFPAYALLLARFLEPFLSGRQPDGVSKRWVSIPQWITAGIFFILGLGLVGFGGRVAEVPYWMTVVLGSLLAGVGVAIAASLKSGAPGRSVERTWAGIAVVYLFVVTAIMPALNHVKSSKEFTLRVVEETAISRARGDQVVALHLFNIPVAMALHSKGMYTLDTLDPEILEEHLRHPTRVWAVVNMGFVADLPDDVAQRMTTVATARLSRQDVALVHNGAEP